MNGDRMQSSVSLNQIGLYQWNTTSRNWTCDALISPNVWRRLSLKNKGWTSPSSLADVAPWSWDSWDQMKTQVLDKAVPSQTPFCSWFNAPSGVLSWRTQLIFHTEYWWGEMWLMIDLLASLEWTMTQLKLIISAEKTSYSPLKPCSFQLGEVNRSSPVKQTIRYEEAVMQQHHSWWITSAAWLLSCARCDWLPAIGQTLAFLPARCSGPQLTRTLDSGSVCVLHQFPLGS